MMPEAVEQVPTKREEKARIKLKHGFGSHWVTTTEHETLKKPLFGFMQALDLILYRHGRPQAVNTSQNIYRMNPVFGHRAPLCVLTWGPKEFIQQLVYEHRKHKSQRSSLFCPKALWPLSDW